MRKMFSVLHYEYKMQFKRLVTWGVLLVATALSLLDNFPSAGNLARLEFLDEPAYFVYRIVSLDSLVLLFGLMFLLAGRIPIDTKTGMKSLLMSSALRKWFADVIGLTKMAICVGKAVGRISICFLHAVYFSFA